MPEPCPETFRAASTSSTVTPASARRIALAAPAAPPPTTRTELTAGTAHSAGVESSEKDGTRKRLQTSAGFLGGRENVFFENPCHEVAAIVVTMSGMPSRILLNNSDSDLGPSYVDADESVQAHMPMADIEYVDTERHRGDVALLIESSPERRGSRMRERSASGRSRRRCDYAVFTFAIHPDVSGPPAVQPPANGGRTSSVAPSRSRTAWSRTATSSSR